jgi:hypothetical protein
LKRKKNNDEVIEKLRQKESLNKAVRKAKETSGIDFLAILLGDKREKRKYEMKMLQAAMECEYEECAKTNNVGADRCMYSAEDVD